jgi:hypothetical protein
MLRNNVLFEPDENSSLKDVGAKRARKSLSSQRRNTPKLWLEAASTALMRSPSRP